MKKYLFAIAIFISSLTFGQDVHFSQLQETPLWLNPANAGFMNGYFRAIANYRNQWATMGNAYQTMAVSVDASTLKTKTNLAYMGIGLFVFNDQAGVAKMGATQAQLHLNAIIKAGDKSKIGGGIYFGLNQHSANYSALTYGNQFDGKIIDNSIASGESVVYDSYINTDVGVGINYEFSNATIDMLRDDIVSFKIGGAVHHINKPVQKFGSGSSYQLPMRFVGNIQGRIDIKEAKISVLPSVVFLQQGIASQVTFGTYIRCRFKNPTKLTGVKSETALNIGLFYRVNDAIIPQLNLDLGKFAIGVAYDLNVSKYRQVTNLQGGYEIFLKFISLDDALFKRKREHGLN